MRQLLVALALALAACGASSADPTGIEPLPTTSATDIAQLLATSERPVLVNVWASWCIPCRSEAPLLLQAHGAFGDDVRFVGIDVRDNQSDARDFIGEFGLDVFEHYFDRNAAVPASLEARGVPLTFFFRAGGELSYAHRGVIDERTLAVHLDELTR